MPSPPFDSDRALTDEEAELKFDFSEFHPLMHRIASRECWGWYGGPIQHAKLWWQYQRPGAIDLSDESKWTRVDPREYRREYKREKPDGPSD